MLVYHGGYPTRRNAKHNPKRSRASSDIGMRSTMPIIDINLVTRWTHLLHYRQGDHYTQGALGLSSGSTVERAHYSLGGFGAAWNQVSIVRCPDVSNFSLSAYSASAVVQGFVVGTSSSSKSYYSERVLAAGKSTFPLLHVWSIDCSLVVF